MKLMSFSTRWTVLPGLALAVALAFGGCATTTTTTTTNSAGGSTTVPSGQSPERETAGQPSTGDDRRARARLELATNYFASGQNATALEEVRLALSANPNSSQAYSLQGLIYGAMGDMVQAESSFRRALQVDARDPDTMHNFGWFLCQQGRYDEAHNQFRTALALPTYREPSRTLLVQGVCFARAQRLGDAETTLMRAYEIDAGNPVIGFNLADVLFRRNELERARFFLRRINQQQEQSNVQTLWLAARVEHKLGNNSAVANLGEQMKARYPRAPETLAYERGRFDE
jgi:type IV pilus assembly protein PilF